MPTEEKEKALWVELKRLYEPTAADVFWKLQRYMHDSLTWKLYTNCGLHQVSSTRRHDIFMFTEKDYPLTDVVLLLMMSTKLQVDEDCEMDKDLVMKIFMEANKPKSRRIPPVPDHKIKDSKEDPYEDPTKEEEEMEEDMDLNDEIEKAELILPYKEVDPLNPPQPGSNSESEDEIIPLSGPIFQLPPPIHRFSGRTIIMPPRRITQVAIEKLISDKVTTVIAVDHATKSDTGGPAGRVGGPTEAPAICECTFAGFMKCNPVTFHGTEGAVELCRWFKKMKIIFRISEYAEVKKVKFAAATIQD
nr:hypothetical protein [Tanacetum cinerariifolium]GEV73477.1 hypothetical protein [Tanacetum cinerariifolium]